MKEPGGRPKTEVGPADTTEALVDALARSDLFVTSGHATEHDWQIGFSYRNGSFRCRDGKLFGLDTQKKEHPIDSPTPKVYLAVGNCLMGHVDGPDCMALAWMNSGGVAQMVGYTDLTWFGYGGWGCLDYFVEQPGRYTLAEAFLANDHALVNRLESGSAPKGDIRGLAYDRDIVALYGDPAWEARMAEHEKAWDQSLAVSDGLYTLEIVPRRGAATFRPINVNGSQPRRPSDHPVPAAPRDGRRGRRGIGPEAAGDGRFRARAEPRRVRGGPDLPRRVPGQGIGALI